MKSHLRANLWLLFFTVILCNVAYPVVLLVIGQTVFRDQAEGSLIYDKEGKAIGSRLIAQPFSGEGFFQPRPSAVSYNAAGSGASNWGANNYLLRERVARQLGPIVKYKGGSQAGQPVGPRRRRDLVSAGSVPRATGHCGAVGRGAFHDRGQLGQGGPAQRRVRRQLDERPCR